MIGKAGGVSTGVGTCAQAERFLFHGVLVPCQTLFFVHGLVKQGSVEEHVCYI